MSKATTVCMSIVFVVCGLQNAAAEDQAMPYLALFAPLPHAADNPANPLTEPKVKLGKKLYADSRLSKSGKLSCNSCHDLNRFGVDNMPTSPGHQDQRGERNSPTVYNAALHALQFWDGREKDVETQALGPILNPVEMAMDSGDAVMNKLRQVHEYRALFAQAFSGEADPLTFANLGKAIGAFERTLLTPSRFDAYLKGDRKALSSEEEQGIKTFVQTGCTVCHSGGAGGRDYAAENGARKALRHQRPGALPSD